MTDPVTDKMIPAIIDGAEQTRMPDGRTWLTISVAKTLELCRRFGLTGRDIEIAALENGVVPLRYQRNMKSYDATQQIRLLRSRAAVIGLGGLGGTVVEILARSGVGTLVLVDGDRFEDHNLNRQLLSTEADAGMPKAAVAAQRAKSVNSAVEAIALQVELKQGNMADILGGCHVVIDCLDNIPDRFTLEAGARNSGVPFVSAAVAGASGHVTTIFPEDAGLVLVYGPEHQRTADKGVETELGCLPQAVMLIASLECAEALKVLLGQQTSLLRNRMLLVDLGQNIFEVLRLA